MRRPVKLSALALERGLPAGWVHAPWADARLPPPRHGPSDVLLTAVCVLLGTIPARRPEEVRGRRDLRMTRSWCAGYVSSHLARGGPLWGRHAAVLDLPEVRPPG